MNQAKHRTKGQALQILRAAGATAIGGGLGTGSTVWLGARARAVESGIRDFGQKGLGTGIEPDVGTGFASARLRWISGSAASGSDLGTGSRSPRSLDEGAVPRTEASGLCFAWGSLGTGYSFPFLGDRLLQGPSEGVPDASGIQGDSPGQPFQGGRLTLAGSALSLEG